MSSSNIFGGSDERPTTPPELLKFRRSAQDVGKRYVHPGLVDDLKKMNLESKPCGKRSDPPDKNTAKSVIHSKPQTITEKINTMKAEMNSKQPKLGKSQDLGSIPTDFDHDRVRGVTTKGSEAAKDVVNPQPKEDPMKGHDLYRVSHGSYLPGEQKMRNYDWTVDPNNVRFGKKSELVGFNGISLGVTEALSGSKDEGVVSSKALEDYRDMGNTLGRRRNRGLVDSSLPPSHSYGLPTGQDGWDAAKVLKGSYDERDQLPDADLGKTLTPGFRNISMDVSDHCLSCGVPWCVSWAYTHLTTATTTITRSADVAVSNLTVLLSLTNAL